jgi:prevent-host-death family protein
MKIASVADVKAHFSAYLKASEEGAVVVTRNGKPVAALLGVRDEDELDRLVIAHSPRLQAILDAARRRIQAGEGVPEREFWEKVQARQKNRKRGDGV